MDRETRNVFLPIWIGVAVAVAGVAMPLGFDIDPWIWRSVFCFGVFISGALSAYLLYEHFAREHPDTSIRRKRTIFLVGGTAVTGALAIWAAISIPQPKNYGALILAKLDAISSKAAQAGVSIATPSAAPAASLTTNSSAPRERTASKTGALQMKAIPPPQPTLKPKLLIECGLGGLPDKIPPSGELYEGMLFYNPANSAPQYGGTVGRLFGSAGADIHDPSQPLQFAIHCDVINYSDAIIINLSATIFSRFIEVTKNGVGIQGGRNLVTLPVLLQFPRIEPGPSGAERFYIVNSSKFFTEVTFAPAAFGKNLQTDEQVQLSVEQAGDKGLFLSPPDQVSVQPK